MAHRLCATVVSIGIHACLLAVVILRADVCLVNGAAVGISLDTIRVNLPGTMSTPPLASDKTGAPEGEP